MRIFCPYNPGLILFLAINILAILPNLTETGQRVPDIKLYSKYSLTHAHYSMFIMICSLQNKQCELFHAFFSLIFFLTSTEDIWPQKLLNAPLLTLYQLSVHWPVLILLCSTALFHLFHTLEWKISEEWSIYVHEVLTSHFPAPGKNSCYQHAFFLKLDLN